MVKRKMLSITNGHASSAHLEGQYAQVHSVKRKKTSKSNRPNDSSVGEHACKQVEPHISSNKHNVPSEQSTDSSHTGSGKRGVAKPIPGWGGDNYNLEMVFNEDMQPLDENGKKFKGQLGVIAKNAVFLPLNHKKQKAKEPTPHKENIWVEEIKALSVKNRAIRKKQKMPHTSGRKSHYQIEPEQPPLKTAVLDKYGTDLTKAASEGKIDVVIGRQKQIDRVVQILCKKERNNACLVGDFSGAGKTVLVAEGVAQRISNGIAPQKLLKKKVYSVDLAQLNTGTETREKFKEIFSKIINEVKASNGGIILFIDELHEALEGTNDILKAALAGEEFKCVGATTLTKYSCCIEKDSKIESRFSLVNVPEPTLEETVEILKGVRKKFEAFHSVKYSDTALVTAARLSKLHTSDGFLKAIDLLDEAGARTHLFPTQTLVIDLVDEDEAGTNLLPTQTHVVTEAEILEQVSDITGIPVEKVATDKEESTRLLKMEDVLSRHIIGQEEAVGAVSRAIRRASVGIRNPDRPIASFLFVGPTGVGKTELAKLLATEYFGSKEAMVRLDMSEYKERHSVSKLFGPPPGYVGHHEGGQLTEAVRRRPHNMILLDEIEKAHPEVFDAFLQILDDGRLTDSKGKTVDFKNTIIIMTSNVGGHLTEESDDDGTSSVKERVGEELKKVFKPEFLNRIDEVVVFNRLGRTQMEVILKEMIEEVNTRLKEKNLCLVVSENLKEKLLEEGYNPMYGARAMRRAVTRLIEDKVAERILGGKVNEGRIFMDIEDSLME